MPRILTRRSLAAVGALVPVLSLAAQDVSAQVISFRLSTLDMFGGVVLPRNAMTGVTFGTRVGLASVFGRSARLGIVLSWWTADRGDVPVDVRDLVLHVDVWREFGSSRARAYLGLGAGLHALDSTLQDVRVAPDRMTRRVVDDLEGYRPGAAGLAGASLRVTSTGVIWLVMEYRFSAVARASHHEVRAGLRLRPGGL